MECIFCGNKFFSSREEYKVCPVCERAIERLHIGMAPDRLFELAQAEKAGRLVASNVSGRCGFCVHYRRIEGADRGACLIPTVKT